MPTASCRRGRGARRAISGRIEYPEFATDPCRSLFQRVTAMFSPTLTDNANVNLVKLGERFIAMTETPIPVQFDPETLAAAGVPYRAPGQLTTAHPHLDRASGGMLNYAAKLGPRSSYRFFHLAPDATEPQVIASRAVREPAYMHSFGLSERWLVLVEFPFVVNPLRLATGGRPYIENYQWKPELGTRFHLFDRRTGAHAGPFEADPCFAFHHVNAYDDGDDVVVDMCVFPDAGIVEDLYLERLRAGKPVTSPYLERFRVTVGTGQVRRERLVDEPLDLPRINYPRSNERPYRYVWGAGIGSGWFDRIVKADLVQRRATVWTRGRQLTRRAGVRRRPGREGRGRGRGAVGGAGRRRKLVPARPRRRIARGVGPGAGSASHPVRVSRDVRRAVSHPVSGHPGRAAP